MFKTAITTLLLAMAIVASPAFAVDQATLPSEDFVISGDTIFVRPGERPYGWMLKILQQLKIKQNGIKKIVFVNMGNVGRWDRVGGEKFMQPLLKKNEITTIVVGACENYCAARFAGGAKRMLTADSYLDIKTPIDSATIDSSTMLLEPKYPNSQFAMFEREEATPGVIPYKNIFVEAFTKGGMTGGTRFYLDKVEFCAARSPDAGCKLHEGLNAVKVGLVTDPTPATVTLPEGW